MAPTPAQTVGPFFGFALPFEGDANAVAPGSAGAIRVEGQVFDGAGEPVPDALLEVVGSDQFARCRTDPEGAFHFVLRKPPAHHPHAPHLDLLVHARGLLRHLATRLYFPDETAANAADPVLAMVEPKRRRTLIAEATEGGLRLDIHLQGEEETVFIEL